VCGRYSLAVDPAQLRARFSLGPGIEIRPRYNIAPGDELAAVTSGRDGEPRGQMLRWGLVPHWSRTPDSGARMINARAETLSERPSYREALQRFRCLIPADGFYEWQARAGLPKLPWHITRGDGRPFAFAGLWAVWRPSAAGDERPPIRTCTIITTRASPGIAELHDRMPVMLEPAAEKTWLDPSTSQGDLADLLRPFRGELAARPVGRAVSDAKYDGPDCLADADPADLAPATLF
jgi:putative SOS response-associated peptidase YedK